MSYPDQVPPTKREWDLGTGCLGVLGVAVFLLGCFVFVKSDTPTGGLAAGFIVSCGIAAVMLAGTEKP